MLKEHPVGILPDRVRPHAPDIEKAVLSALLREPENSLETVFEKCNIDSLFYSQAHNEIFQAILAIHRDEKIKVDLLSVIQYLREQKKLEAVGGEVYVAGLYDALSTTVNLESWCSTLQKYATLRRMIDVCAAGLASCYDDNSTDISELLEKIETDFYNIRGEGEKQSVRELKDLLTDRFEYLMQIYKGERPSGIPTGFRDIDDCTGGLKKGEMFVLAARPSIGKTALALNVVRNIAALGEKTYPVAFFSLEMTAEQLALRLITTQSRIPESAFVKKTFKAADMPVLTSAIHTLGKAKLYVDPTPGLTLAELRAKARRLKHEHHIELIVIDYLQLMHADVKTESRQQEVAMISGGIKKLAKDLDIPVLVLAQLNREVDKATGQNARPKLANLRESGAIEQDADVVTFLHRNREESKGSVVSTEAEWIVEKNRNGETRNCKLVFYPSRMEFETAARESEEHAPPPRR